MTTSRLTAGTGAIEHVPVLIAGAGPVGLILALELERQGVKALLVERNNTTTRHPKMDITNGRSMELFRRLGIADYLRKIATPADNPTVVSWVTRLDRWELTRFTYPSADDTAALIRSRNDGTLPLEPSMRVSQILLEPALKELHETLAQHITVQYGWKVDTFTQDGTAVDVILRCGDTGETRQVRADYLVGCDGGGSTVQGVGHRSRLHRSAPSRPREIGPAQGGRHAGPRLGCQPRAPGRWSFLYGPFHHHRS
ncbi:FAD-dependent monooxygenase [Mycobacterium camsae]|uniref:FAD-dependent monooxygenase n=1 Tax=Mycobacterium gordonae TaxID=1778 RepID=UPI00198078F7|nr:FAD-dependent monooxygenase [Mycobacterium gordonae]